MLTLGSPEPQITMRGRVVDSFGRSSECSITAEFVKDPREWWATWAAHTPNENARFVIQTALDGDLVYLADRLRVGAASSGERAFAADVIEGKVRPYYHRKGKPTRRQDRAILRRVFAYQLLHSKGSKDWWPEKKIKDVVAALYGVKPRYVYNLLEDLTPKQRKSIADDALWAVENDLVESPGERHKNGAITPRRPGLQKLHEKDFFVQVV
jgi:hypothetical protein